MLPLWHGKVFRISGPLWGHPPVNGGFIHKWPVIQNFGVSLLLAWTGCCTNSRVLTDLRHYSHPTSLNKPIITVLFFLTAIQIAVISLPTHMSFFTWWRHQMETFSSLLTLCAGYSPVTCEFLAQRPVTRSFDVFVDLRIKKTVE